MRPPATICIYFGPTRELIPDSVDTRFSMQEPTQISMSSSAYFSIQLSRRMLYCKQRTYSAMIHVKPIKRISDVPVDVVCDLQIELPILQHIQLARGLLCFGSAESGQYSHHVAAKHNTSLYVYMPIHCKNRATKAVVDYIAPSSSLLHLTSMRNHEATVHPTAHRFSCRSPL